MGYQKVKGQNNPKNIKGEGFAKGKPNEPGGETITGGKFKGKGNTGYNSKSLKISTKMGKMDKEY